MKTAWEVIAKPSGFDSASNYMGKRDFPNMYCVVTQNRDSDCFTRSNFTVALEMLGGESENVEILHFGHWACGWWEMIAVKGNTPEYEIALDIEKKIENYPLLDEDKASQLEYDETAEFWANCSIKERIGYCKESDVSIFAARHDYLPETPTGELIVNLYN